MPYGLIVILGFGLVLLDIRQGSRENRVLIRFVFLGVILSMIIIGGLRDGVGFDTGAYTRIFDRLPKLSTNFLNVSRDTHGEIGFKVLIGGLKTLGFKQVQSLFVIIIVSALLLNRNSLRKYTPYFYTSFFLYICFYFFGREMGQIRQGLATAIVLFSIRFIIDRKLLQFIITVFVAASFHASSLVILPFYFIAHKEFSRKHYILILLFGIILNNVSWLRGNVAYIESVLRFELPYIENMRYGYQTGSLLSFQYLRRLFPAILVIVGYEKLKSKFEYFTVLSNVLMGGVFLSLIFHEVAIYVERLFAPMIFVEIILLGFFVDYFENRYLRLFYRIFIIGYGTLYFINLMTSKLSTFFPYKNILF